MTPITIADLSAILAQESHHLDNQSVVTGICTDNRTVRPGDAFVAFVGEHVDGHNFVEAAFDCGASVAIVTKPVKTNKGPVLRVDDSLTAIQKIALRERKLFDGPVVGITGSNGKTTTKQMVASVLSRYKTHSCLYTQGNQNNELGVPLTILQRKPEHRSMVLEMGMRGRGQISALCRIAVPNIGVVTNIGHSHIELLGSQENIALAKGELLEALSSDGFAILNADDEWSAYIRQRTNASVLWYGLSDDADVRARDFRMTSEGMMFEVSWMGEWGRFKIPTYGQHNVRNALAAVAVGRVLGMNMSDIAEGLATMGNMAGRLKVLEARRDMSVIDDCYNASPISVEASLEILSNFPRPGSRVAILGDMYELGLYAESGHRMVGEAVVSQGIDQLIAIGKQSAWIVEQAALGGMTNVYHFRTVDEAKVHLDSLIEKGSVVLVKASRGMYFEKIVQYLSLK